MSQSPATPSQFALLSNHGQALVAIADNPDVRLREIAEQIGITERATQSIVNDLVGAGYAKRTRVGRRNSYTVDPRKPFRHPLLAHGQVGSLLSGLVPWKAPNHGDPTATAADPGSAPGGRDQRPSPIGSVGIDPDEGLDRLTSLAGWLLHTPISFISIIAGDTEVITSGVGVPEPLMRRPLPLQRSICQHVVAAGEPLVIFDASEHPLLRDNPAVTTYGLHSCAGLPLVGSDGTALGSLCVADTRPRQWTQGEVAMLTSLATAAASQVEIGVVSRHHREAAERYRMLLDSLPETLILVFDRDLRIQVASGAALVRSGLIPADMIGRTLDETATPEVAAQVRPHYQAGLDGHPHEFLLSAGNTSYSIDVVPLRDASGTVHAVMALGREQLTYGRSDHWDAERLRALVENIPGAIYRCAATNDWRMEFISAQIEAITGHPASDFIENNVRSYASVIHPDDRAMVERTVAEAIANNQPFILEYRILTSNGSTRWVRERGQGIHDTAGHVLYLDGAIFAIDETSRRLAA